MNSRRLAYVALGLVALIVVAVSASTLTTFSTPAGGDPGEEEGEREVTRINDRVGGGAGFGYLIVGIFFLLAAAAVLSFLRYPLDSLKSAAASILGGAIALVLFLVVLWAGDSSSSNGGADPEPSNSTTTPSPTGGSGGLGGGEGDAIGEGASTVLQDPPFLILLGLGVVLVSIVAVAIMGIEDDESAPGDEYGVETGGQLAEMGRIAGAAADRLDASAGVENEVYRAWKEMTELLDLSAPATRTPGEFREAAIEIGMAPDDVQELTVVFEEVRYGGAEPDEIREERAVTALRRIEDTYADPADPTAVGTKGDSG